MISDKDVIMLPSDFFLCSFRCFFSLEYRLVAACLSSINIFLSFFSTRAETRLDSRVKSSS